MGSSRLRHVAMMLLALATLGLGGCVLDRPELTPAQQDILRRRDAARRARDWAQSDILRDDLAAMGIGLKDRPEGTVWYVADLSLFNKEA